MNVSEYKIINKVGNKIFEKIDSKKIVDYSCRYIIKKGVYKCVIPNFIKGRTFDFIYYLLL